MLIEVDQSANVIQALTNSRYFNVQKEVLKSNRHVSADSSSFTGRAEPRNGAASMADIKRMVYNVVVAKHLETTLS